MTAESHSSSGDHALDQPGDILTNARVDAHVLLHILQFHLLQQDIQHEDAAGEIVLGISGELRVTIGGGLIIRDGRRIARVILDNGS